MNDKSLILVVEDRASLRRMLVWSLPWLGLGIVMLLPSLADEIARLLGLETATGIDLMAYVAVGVAFYLGVSQ